ncbi:peptidase inhibitor family I36 protein [Streptomyces sp. NPDC091215]|uniref:peptidase inhibitor family I36 protein n=1 Tax=Streptomyces sp. NPDC091215 TaxID=3155192 RepID=UPI0034151235
MTAAVSLACGLGVDAHAAASTPHAAQDGGCYLYSGVACFWPYKSGDGVVGKVADNNSDFTKLYNSSGCANHNWNDCIDSIQNGGTQCVVYFWTDAGYRGRYHSLDIGDAVWDFGAPKSDGGYNDPSFDKSISSNHWCTPN